MLLIHQLLKNTRDFFFLYVSFILLPELCFLSLCLSNLVAPCLKNNISPVLFLFCNGPYTFENQHDLFHSLSTLAVTASLKQKEVTKTGNMLNDQEVETQSSLTPSWSTWPPTLCNFR